MAIGRAFSDPPVKKEVKGDARVRTQVAWKPDGAVGS
jgi:hypothetical protein